MTVYLDLAGLTNQPDPAAYASVLGLHGEPIPDRLLLLARLVNGAGVTIITGPMGREFWSIVSPEIKIKVEPDGYEYKDRLSIRVWSAILGGVPASHAAKDTGHKKYYDQWKVANSYRRKIKKLLHSVHSIIEEAFPSRLANWNDLDRLFAAEGFIALDWEWDEETLEPLGLACSGAVDNLYIPCGVSARGDFRDRMLCYAVVLHVGKADIKTQWPEGYDPIELVGTSPHDTSVMAYLLGEKDLHLKVLTRKQLGRDPVDYDSRLTKDPVIAARYAAAGDTRNTYDLWRKMVPELIEKGQWDVYARIERPLIPVIASMERYGMPVDMGAVWTHYKSHIAIERGLRQSFREHWGYDLRSDDETRRFLREQTGFDPGTLDQRILSLNPAGYVDLILEYRKHRTRRRNFLGATIKRWLAAGKPGDFRVFPHYTQSAREDGDGLAPGTGRLSSADPNMQNQPLELRDIYVPPAGCLWFAFDYSTVELRIAAQLSGDTTMQAGLADDVHAAFQQRILELTGQDVGRQAAKEGNFEQLYGGGAATLQKLLAKKRAFLDLAGCQAIVDAHRDTFPVYHQWAEQIISGAHRDGYAETAAGRRRYLPDLSSLDPKARQHAERAAVSHAVQGTAADTIKMAMDALGLIMPQFGAHMATTVHDEIAGWVRGDVDQELFKAVVIATMQSVAFPGLHLEVIGKLGKNWKECH